jgi:hypothetical protein
MCICLHTVVSNTSWLICRVSYKKQELLILREHLGATPDFGGARVPHHLFSFLCCVVVSISSCVLCSQCCQCLWIVFVLCLVFPMLSVSLDCLRPVSCVPNVVSVSGLSSSCVLCSQCCQCLWIVYDWLHSNLSNVYLEKTEGAIKNRQSRDTDNIKNSETVSWSC